MGSYVTSFVGLYFSKLQLSLLMTKITQVVEPLTSEILFIDPLGTESRRLMKQIQKTGCDNILE